MQKKKSIIKNLKGQNIRIYKNKRTWESPKILKKMVILIGYHKNTNERHISQDCIYENGEIIIYRFYMCSMHFFNEFQKW